MRVSCRLMGPDTASGSDILLKGHSISALFCACVCMHACMHVCVCVCVCVCVSACLSCASS